MASNENNLLMCYNKGCNQKFDPDNNLEDACRHHPGVPYFHDAYKGWTCCNKKSINFTEFLNYPGCTLSKHSNVKPEEPAKPVQSLPDEVIEVKPTAKPEIVRPAFDSPMIIMKPNLAPSVKHMVNLDDNNITQANNENEDIIKLGTPCQNNGCKITFEEESTNEIVCLYHPGSPIFHEGLKYWSCCQKRTSDFQTFINQEGCTRGSHVWHKKQDTENVECRWDWHQTGNEVVISLYAKEYCPNTSFIKINPVRVVVSLIFPKEGNATFNLDIETRGVVDVEKSKATMYGSKIEINLRKAQLIKWEQLEIPRQIENIQKDHNKVEKLTPQVDALDLDDL